MAMTSVVRAPWTSPAQMLRPRESVPNGCSADGIRNGWATILERVVRGDQRRDRREEHHEAEPREPGEDPRVAEEALPEGVHSSTVMRGSSST